MQTHCSPSNVGHNRKLSMDEETFPTWIKRYMKGKKTNSFLPCSVSLHFVGVHFLFLSVLQIIRCFIGPTWPSFFISLTEYLTKWPDLLRQLLSPVGENQELAPSLDKNAILQIFCCLLQWLNLITEEISFMFEKLDWCLGEVNSLLWKTAKNPSSHLTSLAVRISPL